MSNTPKKTFYTDKAGSNVKSKNAHINRKENNKNISPLVSSQQTISSVSGIHMFQRTAGNRAVNKLIQTKLQINRPGDEYEKEADRTADTIMKIQKPEEMIEKKPVEEEISPLRIDQKSDTASGNVNTTTTAGIEASRGSGERLAPGTAQWMSQRMGSDFSDVRVHTDSHAAELSNNLSAQAFTVGKDVYFGDGKFDTGSSDGKKLLAHELTHVVQQSKDGIKNSQLSNKSIIQRTIGDGHDLSSPRFSKIEDLEAAYDNETVIKIGSKSRGVQAIQQALYDLGYSLPKNGADGDFGNETKAAVRSFQTKNTLFPDGNVGPKTMKKLDLKFPAPVLPDAKTRSGMWTPAGVKAILCSWSPRTINVLKTKITLKSFDSISWTDEEWNGASWVPAIFQGGGYNTGKEIGVLNSSNEEMAQTLYHEVLHAEQPTTHKTTGDKERYAYRIGEEFSIAMGLTGRPSLRSTDLQGRQFADPAKVDSFVSSTYPSIPSGGANEEIVGKSGIMGNIIVERANGSRYTRPANIGEKVPGLMSAVNEKNYPKSDWK